MTGSQGEMIRMAETILTDWPFRKTKPRIIFGGPHPTFFPEDFKDWEIVKGEAENWLNSYLGGPDVTYDIDSLPWPDRTDFPDRPIRDFITSRGCPFDCSYCYNKKWAEMFADSPRVRVRTVDDVVAEIKSVRPEFVYFQDSTFGVGIKWLREFRSKYRDQVKIPFHAHLRPNQIDEERVIMLAESGCYSVRIALESGSNKLRNILNRKMTNADVYTAVRLLKKWGIKVMVQNMIGLPTGTIEDDLYTLEMNIKMHPTYAWVSIFAPYPGTELGDRCKREGWYKGDYGDMSDSFFDTSVLEFSPGYKEQLECLQKCFALCSEIGYLPEPNELTHENFPQLVHNIMRKEGTGRCMEGWRNLSYPISALL
jgi:anaerobic magnesium-protoporphyrin IX monomethyl ester cyclase